jgi:hypothetical protein
MERAIVILTDADDASTIHTYGYETDSEIADALLDQTRAIWWQAGLALIVTRPDELVR